MLVLTNNAGSSLAIAIAAADTQAQILAADAARFPQLVYPDDLFHARIRSGAGNYEYVRVVARDGVQLTLERGCEGTVARDFAAGSSFELMVTAESWELLGKSRWVRPKNAAGGILLPTRVDATSFTVAGDQTTIFAANRALHLIQGASAYGYVSSSVCAGGVTTVTVKDCAVDAGLAAVELGLEVEAAPKYNNASNADTLGGSTKAQVVTEALAGTAANANALAGKSEAQILAEARTGIADAVTPYTRQQYAAPVAVAPVGGAVTLDAYLHQDCEITSTVALTMNAPVHPENGMQILMRLYAATALGITWNDAFVKNGNDDLPTAHVAGKGLYVNFRYNGVKWVMLAQVPEA